MGTYYTDMVCRSILLVFQKSHKVCHSLLALHCSAGIAEFSLLAAAVMSVAVVTASESLASPSLWWNQESQCLLATLREREREREGRV